MSMTQRLQQELQHDHSARLYLSIKTWVTAHLSLVMLFFLASTPPLVYWLAVFGGHSYPLPFSILLSFLLYMVYGTLYFSGKNYRIALVAVFAISFLLKTFLALQFFGTFDMDSYQTVAGIMEKGTFTNFYAETDRYNYSPLWAYTLHAIDSFGDFTGLAFPFLVKLFLISVDIFVGILLLRIAQGEGLGAKEQFTIVSKFLYNPISIMVTVQGAQFDMAAISLLLLFYYRSEIKRKRTLLEDVIYGCSIAVKQVTVFPLFFFALQKKSFNRSVLFLFIASVPFWLLITPYLSGALPQIISNVFGYGGIFGTWGYSRALEYITTLFGWTAFQEMLHAYLPKLMIIMTFLVMIFYFSRYRNIKTLDGILISLLFFIVLLSGFGTQYLVWIVPFLCLHRSDFYAVYTFLGSFVAFFFYLGHGLLRTTGAENLFLREVVAYSLFGPLLYLFCIYMMYRMHRGVVSQRLIHSFTP